MNISTESREILRNYKAVMNARRREIGQKPLTTAQIVDEICDFVVNQQAVFIGGQYILQAAKTGDTGAGDGGRLSARAKTPDRLTASKSVMAFRVLLMTTDLSRLTTGTMNVNAGHKEHQKLVLYI
ncbi:hypothetical protein WC5_00113 [Escherichia sp. KTE114]|nr:hypothetical protein WC5_00113 [Escherichia sp. KTE114]